MAVVVSFVPIIDERIYSELPKGVSRYVAPVTSTGTSGGTSMEFDLLFNEKAASGFQRYVSISSITLETQVAALVIPRIRAKTSNGQWEDTVTVRTLAEFQVFPFYTAITMSGGIYEPLYLGRTKKDTQGKVEFLCEEVDTTVYQLYVTGFISEKPFLAPAFWKA